MLIFPYRRFEIRSPGDPLTVSHLLGELTQRRHRWFRWPGPEIRFVGKVSPEQFRVVPVTRGTNSYAPWIVGTITSVGGGSVIGVRMTLHPVAVVAMLLFTGVPQYLSFADTRAVNVEWLALMAVFHVVMYYIAFLPEARKAESLIRDIAAIQAA